MHRSSSWQVYHCGETVGLRSGACKRVELAAKYMLV
jgi:hypothetical protein